MEYIFPNENDLLSVDQQIYRKYVRSKASVGLATKI